MITITKRTNFRALQQVYGDVILLCEELGLQTSQRIPFDHRTPQISALLTSGAKFSRISSNPRDQGSQRPVYIHPATRGGAVYDDLCAVEPESADSVKQRIGHDGSRPLMLSCCNGRSEQLDGALPLAVECPRTEKDPHLRSVFDAAVNVIRDEIDQLRRRYDEDLD